MSMTANSTIHWRYAAVASLDAQIDRAGGGWLSPREELERGLWQDESRRLAWLRGRMLAKQLLIARSREPLAPNEVEILSRDAAGRVNRPIVWRRGQRMGGAIAISHSSLGVLVGFSSASDTEIGVDLAPCHSLPESVVRLWFSPGERQWLARAGSQGIDNFIWAAKEAVYKACNRGEGFDPRAVEILAARKVRYRGGLLAGLELRSRVIDNHIAVFAALRNRESTTKCLTPLGTTN